MNAHLLLFLNLRIRFFFRTTCAHKMMMVVGNRLHFLKWAGMRLNWAHICLAQSHERFVRFRRYLAQVTDVDFEGRMAQAQTCLTRPRDAHTHALRPRELWNGSIWKRIGAITTNRTSRPDWRGAAMQHDA